jgi:hypothetical protein
VNGPVKYFSKWTIRADQWRLQLVEFAIRERTIRADRRDSNQWRKQSMEKAISGDSNQSEDDPRRPMPISGEGNQGDGN